MAKIHVVRGEGSIVDGFQAYRVIIDGVTAGKVGEGEVASFDVSPGVHSVRLAVNLHSSLTVKLHVGEQASTLFCRSTTNRLFGWVSLFTPHHWIRTAVREESASAAAPAAPLYERRSVPALRRLLPARLRRTRPMQPDTAMLDLARSA